MFTATLDNKEDWEPILTHPIIQSSILWIKEVGINASFGIHELDGLGRYANVHSYNTKPEIDCKWENHTHTIDIQFVIEGGEKIRWISSTYLGDVIAYDEKTDTQKFQLKNETADIVSLKKGMFAIFLPGDAHCPQIAIEQPALLKKLVVKIPFHLLKNT